MILPSLESILKRWFKLTKNNNSLDFQWHSHQGVSWQTYFSANNNSTTLNPPIDYYEVALLPIEKSMQIPIIMTEYNHPRWSQEQIEWSPAYKAQIGSNGLTVIVLEPTDCVIISKNFRGNVSLRFRKGKFSKRTGIADFDPRGEDKGGPDKTFYNFDEARSYAEKIISYFAKN